MRGVLWSGRPEAGQACTRPKVTARRADPLVEPPVAAVGGQRDAQLGDIGKGGRPADADGVEREAAPITVGRAVESAAHARERRGGGSVDLFDLGDRVVREYASYVTSFFTIRDDRITALVEKELEREGALWPRVHEK
jgi:hypothetical protein